MKNKIRIIVIGVILAVIFSLLFFLLPVTAHFIIAYVFALISILGLILSAIFLTRKGIRVPQDIPFLSTAWTYLIINLVVSIIGVGLQSFYSPIILIVVHILILAFFVVRIILLSGGKEYIDSREDKIAEDVFNIRMMLADLEAIKEKAANLPLEDREKVNKELGTIYDAIRYSDPISHPSLGEYDNEIKETIITLNEALVNGEIDGILNLSVKIQRQIKDRNNRVKILK